MAPKLIDPRRNLELATRRVNRLQSWQLRYNNRLSSNSGAVRCRSDNSGTAPDVPVHLATMVIARVTVLFGINSTSKVIEIARGEAECYFNCFTSAIDP